MSTAPDIRPWLAYPLLFLAVICSVARVWSLVSVLMGLIIVIPVFSPSPRRITIAERKRRLEELFSRFELLQFLRYHMPGLQLELPLRLSGRDSDDHELVSAFKASQRELQQVLFLLPQEELRSAQIDPRLLDMLMARIWSLLNSLPGRFAEHEVIALRIDCAVLPGRCIRFVVSGPSAGHPVVKDLIPELEQIPAIGVRWPVIFSNLFANSRGGDLQLSSLNRPGFEWWDTVDDSGVAEAACRFYGTTSDPAAPLLTIGDCFAWKAVAAFDHSLLSDFSDLLLAEGRDAEAVSVLEEGIAGVADSMLLMHKLAWLLRRLSQHERAAAVCQQLMERFPQYPGGWSMLASLQLRLDRAEDAENTLRCAPKGNRDTEFWITSAEVAAALKKEDAAVSFLNVAILKDFGCIRAFLMQAELFADMGLFDRALLNVEIVERLRPTAPELISFRSRLLAELKRPQDAIEALTVGLKSFPEDTFLQFLRADLLFNSGKPASALEECEEILRKDPRFAAVHELEALIYLESDDPESAEAAAERAIQSGSASSRAWFARGSARLAMQQSEPGVEDLEVACRMSPLESRQRYALARARLACGENELALKELNTLLENHPTSSDGLVFRGFVHIALGNSDLANRDFELASELFPRSASARYGMSVIKRIAGDYPAAIELLDEALEIDPTDEVCLLERAHLLAQKNNLVAATRDLDAVLENTPDFLPALLSRARIGIRLGRFDEARRDLDAVLQQEPESTEALIGRSVLSEKSGDTDSALGDLQKATEQSPENSDRIEVVRLLLQAEIAQNSEQFEEAIGYCSQALEIDPDMKVARLERARALWYSDCFVEALEDYQTLIRSADKPSAELLCCRGGIYNELGEFELALEDLENSRQLAILDEMEMLPWALSSLGRTFTVLERWTDAEAAFRECLRLGHDSPWFHYYRGLYYVARLDYSSAAECFRQSVNTPRRLPPSKRARAEAFLSKHGG